MTQQVRGTVMHDALRSKHQSVGSDQESLTFRTRKDKAGEKLSMTNPFGDLVLTA